MINLQQLTIHYHIIFHIVQCLFNKIGNIKHT